MFYCFWLSGCKINMKLKRTKIILTCAFEKSRGEYFTNTFRWTLRCKAIIYIQSALRVRRFQYEGSDLYKKNYKCHGQHRTVQWVKWNYFSFYLFRYNTFPSGGTRIRNIHQWKVHIWTRLQSSVMSYVIPQDISRMLEKIAHQSIMQFISFLKVCL